MVAGFQVSINGRFWVSAEDEGNDDPNDEQASARVLARLIDVAVEFEQPFDSSR